MHPLIQMKKNPDEGDASEPGRQVLDNWRLIPPSEDDFESVISAINVAMTRYKERPIPVSGFHVEIHNDLLASLNAMYNPNTRALDTDDIPLRRVMNIISDFCYLVTFDMSSFPEFIGSWENVLKSFQKIINSRYFMCSTTFEMLYRTIEKSNSNEREKI